MASDPEVCLLNIVTRHPDGVLENHAKDEACHHLSPKQWREALHALLFSHRLMRFERQGDNILKVPKVYNSGPPLSDNQLTILRTIDFEGSRGITEQGIYSNVRSMGRKDARKALSILVELKAVKKVKSIENKRELIYLASGVEPAPELTGGKWYTPNKEFDTAYVEALRYSCLESVKSSKAQTITAGIALAYLQSKNVSRESLNVEDVQSILYTLELDGFLETVRDATESGSLHSMNYIVYKIGKRKRAVDPLTQTPCGTCPHLPVCHPHNMGVVSPLTASGNIRCPYLQDWLAMSP